MIRYMGLDYGQKRIGIAVSDALGITAQPIDKILRDNHVLENLKSIIDEKDVGAIVIGLPNHMDGTKSPMSLEVEKFAEILKKTFNLPIHFWDERLTSWESENLLISANVKRKKRKEVRDQLAASLILQGFLETVQK